MFWRERNGLDESDMLENKSWGKCPCLYLGMSAGVPHLESAPKDFTTWYFVGFCLSFECPSGPQGQKDQLQKERERAS